MHVSAHNSKVFYRRGLALVLVAAFLYAQWAYNQHYAQIVQHQTSHACVLCLTHGHVGGALVNTAAIHTPATTSVFLQEKHHAIQAREFFHSYGARAPPAPLHI